MFSPSFFTVASIQPTTLVTTQIDKIGADLKGKETKPQWELFELTHKSTIGKLSLDDFLALVKVFTPENQLKFYASLTNENRGKLTEDIKANLEILKAIAPANQITFLTTRNQEFSLGCLAESSLNLLATFQAMVPQNQLSFLFEPMNFEQFFNGFQDQKQGEIRKQLKTALTKANRAIYDIQTMPRDEKNEVKTTALATLATRAIQIYNSQCDEKQKESQILALATRFREFDCQVTAFLKIEGTYKKYPSPSQKRLDTINALNTMMQACYQMVFDGTEISEIIKHLDEGARNIYKDIEKDHSQNGTFSIFASVGFQPSSRLQDLFNEALDKLSIKKENTGCVLQ